VFVITVVVITKATEKDLRKVPRHVQVSFFAWVDAVTHEGLEAVRKVPGYHDEPLAGDRVGTTLDTADQGFPRVYRTEGTTAKLVRVIEINKQEY
jgi:proteic killer suppression protein